MLERKSRYSYRRETACQQQILVYRSVKTENVRPFKFIQGHRRRILCKSTRLGCSVSVLLTLFCIIRITITEHWCSLESYRRENWRTWVMSQPYHSFARQISVGHVRSHGFPLGLTTKFHNLGQLATGYQTDGEN